MYPAHEPGESAKSAFQPNGKYRYGHLYGDLHRDFHRPCGDFDAYRLRDFHGHGNTYFDLYLHANGHAYGHLYPCPDPDGE